MKASQLWNEYKKITPSIGEEFDAWAFGAEPDVLAQLVLDGTKTATASAFDFYQLGGESFPQRGTYDVILDSQGNAVCIIKITDVSICPFNEVSAEHAYKEGEGDRTLDYWRKVHEAFFKPYFEEVGLPFTKESKIVLEEFEVVYPKE